eukprot:105107_1
MGCCCPTTTQVLDESLLTSENKEEKIYLMDKNDEIKNNNHNHIWQCYHGLSSQAASNQCTSSSLEKIKTYCNTTYPSGQTNFDIKYNSKIGSQYNSILTNIAKYITNAINTYTNGYNVSVTSSNNPIIFYFVSTGVNQACYDNNCIIILDSYITNSAQNSYLRPTIYHELFHVLQSKLIGTSYMSLMSNAFLEATATWSEVVYTNSSTSTKIQAYFVNTQKESVTSAKYTGVTWWMFVSVLILKSSSDTMKTQLTNFMKSILQRGDDITGNGWIKVLVTTINSRLSSSYTLGELLVMFGGSLPTIYWNVNVKYKGANNKVFVNITDEDSGTGDSIPLVYTLKSNPEFHCSDDAFSSVMKDQNNDVNFTYTIPKRSFIIVRCVFEPSTLFEPGTWALYVTLENATGSNDFYFNVYEYSGLSPSIVQTSTEYNPNKTNGATQAITPGSGSYTYFICIAAGNPTKTPQVQLKAGYKSVQT